MSKPGALRRLLDLEGAVDARVVETRGAGSFRPKAYIFHLEHGEGIAFVGSSNLTRRALGDGVEWTTASSAREKPPDSAPSSMRSKHSSRTTGRAR